MAALIILSLLSPIDVCALDFSEWLQELREEARQKGISAATLDAALAGVQPIPRIIELDRNQPEFRKGFQEYLDMMVNRKRIVRGRRMLAEHSRLLENIRDRYGVQPRFLVAIWGMETNFGSNLGGYPVISSLATLAFDERRSAFFRSELFHALKILEDGHINVREMQGSWAGAMGQLQFMPSTFTDFAVDGDEDGRKDIWTSLPDVFGSAANFLAGYGWRGNMIWGREVRLPEGFDGTLAGMDKRKSLAEWQKRGVRKINGSDLPVFETDASLILPSGSDGPAFLVYQNYRSIIRWNRSHLYALAVCHLADRLVGTGSLRSSDR